MYKEKPTIAQCSVATRSFNTKNISLTECHDDVLCNIHRGI